MYVTLRYVTLRYVMECNGMVSYGAFFLYATLFINAYDKIIEKTKE